jgi:hypothetical protein
MNSRSLISNKLKACEDEKDFLSGDLLADCSRAHCADSGVHAAKAAAHPRCSGRYGLGFVLGAWTQKMETALARLVM